MNRWRGRQVLDCASALALSQGTRAIGSLQSGRGLPHSKTLARGCPVFLRFMGSMRVNKPRRLSVNRRNRREGGLLNLMPSVIRHPKSAI